MSRYLTLKRPSITGLLRLTFYFYFLLTIMYASFVALSVYTRGPEMICFGPS